MQLKTLLSGLVYDADMLLDAASENIQVTGLQLDSRLVESGDIFFACPSFSAPQKKTGDEAGEQVSAVQSDGRAYVTQAIAQGAVAIVAELDAAHDAAHDVALDAAGGGVSHLDAVLGTQIVEEKLENSLSPDHMAQAVVTICQQAGIPCFLVQGAAQVAAAVACRFYAEPSRKMHVIGVTGTNGKTSVSHWAAQVLVASGKRCAVIGTLGAYEIKSGNACSLGVSSESIHMHGQDAAVVSPAVGAVAPTPATTPNAIDLQRQLAEFLAAGITYVVMEVSSHALVQSRVWGVHFAVAALTQVTQDHLDYHQTLDAYRAAKATLFAYPHVHSMVLNACDGLGQELITHYTAGGANVVSYALLDKDTAPADATITGEVVASAARMQQSLQLHGAYINQLIHVSLLGRFNLENILTVLAITAALNLPAEKVVASIANIQPLPGRMQYIAAAASQPLVVVDYAHTADALAKALQSLAEILQPAGQLWVVFGCGGERDRSKRPEMGRVAQRYADRVVLTSDNPRHEDPMTIITDIQQGMDAHATTQVCCQRADAIAQAVSQAGADDIILVAGKGHEGYQQIGDTYTDCQDALLVERALQQLK